MKVQPASARQHEDLSDAATFARVHREHSASVLRAAQTITQDAATAQDVSQDVFLRLWCNPTRFDPRRGNLATYLTMMARSRALDVWRTRQAGRTARQRWEAVEPAATRSALGEATDEAAQRGLDRAALLSRLQTLPPEQREAIFLTYWGGMTATDVARRCNVPRATVKSRVRLGVSKLRDQPSDLRSGVRSA